MADTNGVVAEVVGVVTRGDDGRVTDNSIKWFIVKYGPWAALAFYMVWKMTGGVTSNIATVNSNVISLQRDISNHVSEQRFYLGAICYMTAKQTGESPAICQPGISAQMPQPMGTINVR